MINCPKCSEQIPETGQFCPQCGLEVDRNLSTDSAPGLTHERRQPSGDDTHHGRGLVSWLLAAGTFLFTVILVTGEYLLTGASGASPDASGLAAPMFFLGLALVGIGLLEGSLTLTAWAVRR